MIVPVHLPEQAGEWAQQLYFFSSDPPYKMEEGGDGTNLSRVLLCTLGQVCCEGERLLGRYDMVSYIDFALL